MEKPMEAQKCEMTRIQEILFEHQDEKYADFTAKLVPTEPRASFIGIRSPEYKSIMKQIQALPQEEIDAFCRTLPHQYHEENTLHISLINNIKDYLGCVAELERFLPYITNWAVSDGLRPAALEKNKAELIHKLPLWIADEKPYTVRVGVLLLMKFYLDEDFKPEYLEWPAAVRSNEYYVNMMLAWFFAEALAKQWDAAIGYITGQRLEPWTHNKAIQKARESYRITPEQKEYLNSLKVKVPRKPQKPQKA